MPSVDKKPHPAVQMSKQRQQAFIDHATPEDFFDMVTLLSQLYFKKMYNASNPKNRPNSLLDDYTEHRKEEARAW